MTSMNCMRFVNFHHLLRAFNFPLRRKPGVASRKITEKLLLIKVPLYQAPAAVEVILSTRLQLCLCLCFGIIVRHPVHRITIKTLIRKESKWILPLQIFTTSSRLVAECSGKNNFEPNLILKELAIVFDSFAGNEYVLLWRYRKDVSV